MCAAWCHERQIKAAAEGYDIIIVCRHIFLVFFCVIHLSEDTIPKINQKASHALQKTVGAVPAHFHIFLSDGKVISGQNHAALVIDRNDNLLTAFQVNARPAVSHTGIGTQCRQGTVHGNPYTSTRLLYLKGASCIFQRIADRHRFVLSCHPVPAVFFLHQIAAECEQQVFPLSVYTQLFFIPGHFCFTSKSSQTILVLRFSHNCQYCIEIIPVTFVIGHQNLHAVSGNILRHPFRAVCLRAVPLHMYLIASRFHIFFQIKDRTVSVLADTAGIRGNCIADRFVLFFHQFQSPETGMLQKTHAFSGNREISSAFIVENLRLHAKYGYHRHIRIFSRNKDTVLCSRDAEILRIDTQLVDRRVKIVHFGHKASKLRLFLRGKLKIKIGRK